MLSTLRHPHTHDSCLPEHVNRVHNIKCGVLAPEVLESSIPSSLLIDSTETVEVTSNLIDSMLGQNRYKSPGSISEEF